MILKRYKIEQSNTNLIMYAFCRCYCCNVVVVIVIVQAIVFWNSKFNWSTRQQQKATVLGKRRLELFVWRGIFDEMKFNLQIALHHFFFSVLFRFFSFLSFYKQIKLRYLFETETKFNNRKRKVTKKFPSSLIDFKFCNIIKNHTN